MTFQVIISYLNKHSDAIIRKDDILTDGVTVPADTGYFWLGPVDAEPGDRIDVKHIEDRFIKIANDEDRFKKYDDLYSYIRWNKEMPVDQQKSRSEIYFKIYSTYNSDETPFNTTGPTQQNIDNRVDEEMSESGVSNSKKHTSAQTTDEIDVQSVPSEKSTTKSKIDDLREQAKEAATEDISESSDTVTEAKPQYTRSQEVKEYVKARADGVCEGCDKPAPFTSKTGDPYLHAHHIHELSKGGSDTIDTVIALCPNCHYRVHHGEDGEKYNHKLLQIIKQKESS